MSYNPSTPSELIDPSVSPGPKQLYGVDEGSNKRFRTDEEVVQKTAPLEKAFLVAAQTWTYTHGLGFRPLFDVTNAAREKMLAYGYHVDENTIEVQHLYNETGYITIR